MPRSRHKKYAKLDLLQVTEHATSSGPAWERARPAPQKKKKDAALQDTTGDSTTPGSRKQQPATSDKDATLPKPSKEVAIGVTDGDAVTENSNKITKKPKPTRNKQGRKQRAAVEAAMQLEEDVEISKATALAASERKEMAANAQAAKLRMRVYKINHKRLLQISKEKLDEEKAKAKLGKYIARFKKEMERLNARKRIAESRARIQEMDKNMADLKEARAVETAKGAELGGGLPGKETKTQDQQSSLGNGFEDHESAGDHMNTPRDSRPDIAVPPELAFEIKICPHDPRSKPRGYGAFATRDIKKGEEILREEALIRGNRQWLNKEALFAILMPETQARYMALHYQCECITAECVETPFMKRWNVNCFAYDEKPAADGYCGPYVYELGARFNHSCLPNLAQALSEEDRLVLRAVYDIEEGTELTVDYILRDGTTQFRRMCLLSNYDFLCECETCTHDITLTEADVDNATFEDEDDEDDEDDYDDDIKGRRVINEDDEEDRQVIDGVDIWFRGMCAKIANIGSAFLETLQSKKMWAGKGIEKKNFLVGLTMDRLDKCMRQNNTFKMDDIFFEMFRKRNQPKYDLAADISLKAFMAAEMGSPGNRGQTPSDSRENAKAKVAEVRKVDRTLPVVEEEKEALENDKPEAEEEVEAEDNTSS